MLCGVNHTMSSVITVCEATLADRTLATLRRDFASSFAAQAAWHSYTARTAAPLPELESASPRTSLAVSSIPELIDLMARGSAASRPGPRWGQGLRFRAWHGDGAGARVSCADEAPGDGNPRRGAA
jgi:hypothetical protein